jgi:hydroxymethylbilane synthase
LPVAALATVRDGHLRLRVAVAAPDGNRVLRHDATGSIEQGAALGAAAARALLDQGAAALLEQAMPVEAAR